MSPRRRSLLAFSSILLVAGFFACSQPPSDARIGVDGPNLAQYSVPYKASPQTPTAGVADMLDHSCGSLDCHGNAQRNLVMWGCWGLRLDPTSAPGCRSMGGTNTTADEYAASYRSLVGLEPALMTNVVANHGNPNDLTFVRKAFGEEAHTGGEVFPLGSPADTCIGSWLSGNMDPNACGNALANSP